MVVVVVVGLHPLQEEQHLRELVVEEGEAEEVDLPLMAVVAAAVDHLLLILAVVVDHHEE